MKALVIAALTLIVLGPRALADAGQEDLDARVRKFLDAIDARGAGMAISYKNVR